MDAQEEEENPMENKAKDREEKEKTFSKKEEENTEDQSHWFLEQLLSEKLKDLVTIEANGGLRLSTCEQISVEV